MYPLMNKIVLAITLMMMTPVAIMAQADSNVKHDVYMKNFTYSPPSVASSMAGMIAGVRNKDVVTAEGQSYIPTLEATVNRSLGVIPRFVMKDGSPADSIANGALVLEGIVYSIGTSIPVKKDGGNKWASVKMALTMKDIATGRITATTTLSADGYAANTESIGEAMAKVAMSIGKKAYEYFASAYPVYGHVLQNGLEKDGKLKQLYIDLGSQWGLYKGQYFAVYIEGLVAGRQTKKAIGRVKVEDVEGSDIALCKVTKGAADIKNAIEVGSSLVVVSE